MHDEEKRVVTIFSALGVVLEKIAESKSKSPDFLSTRGGKLSFFELKTRSGDPNLIKKKGDIISSGGVYAHGEERNIDTGNKKAALESIATSLAQLQNSRKNHPDAYSFIIIQLDDIHRDLTEERWIKTLYGIGDIFYTKKGGVAVGKCNLLHPSSFFKHKTELDGVFILKDGEAKFLTNPYSPNGIKIANGKIFKNFPKCSPILECRFHLPPSLAERNSNENIRLLEEKYSIKVLSIQDWNRDYISKRI